MGKFKMSLAEWMIENLGENAIEKYWSNKNKIDPWKLGKTSEQIIYIKCQKNPHHEDYEITPFNFSRRKKWDECIKCNSFAQWGIENIGNDFLEKYWSDKNKVSPWNISKGIYEKVWITCQDTEYHPDYLVSCGHFTHSKSRCPYCQGRKVHPRDSFAQWGINTYGENFLDKYWSKKNKELGINPWKITKSSNIKIWIKCISTDYHPDSETLPHVFSSTNRKCPYCCNQKIHILDSLGSIKPNSLLVWSEKNENNPFEYAPKTHSIVYWKCENGKHDDYERIISVSNDLNFRCPKCVFERTESMLQEKVRILLTDELNIKVNHERNCELKCINPKTNCQLPYDNEVIFNNKKLIVEVHGEQHYKISTWTRDQAIHKNTTVEEELKYQQWKDQYKKEYALSQRYYYLEIPYWTDNKKEDWKKLILEIINKMNNN
jgi:hypothetical protein